MVKNVDKQKTRLEQKKVKLMLEETRLKLKERKMRTRHLIELGGLVVKAGIDILPTNTLYGALLSLSTRLESDAKIKTEWTKIGADQLQNEQLKYTPVILKFAVEPTKIIRDALRSHGMRWNKFRYEWYGNVTDLPQLKQDLSRAEIEYNLEIIDNIK